MSNGNRTNVGIFIVEKERRGATDNRRYMYMQDILLSVNVDVGAYDGEYCS